MAATTLMQRKFFSEPSCPAGRAGLLAVLAGRKKGRPSVVASGYGRKVGPRRADGELPPAGHLGREFFDQPD